MEHYSGLPEHFSGFSVIEDPRTGGNKEHHFGGILFMAVSAMLCGMNGFAQIEEFRRLETDWLRKWIVLPNGLPRAQTFSNIFGIIDPELFNRCVAEHIGSLCPELRSQIIAIDGKRLRGSSVSRNRGAPRRERLGGGQRPDAGPGVRGRKKSNEIQAIPRLLEMLDIEGHTVTIDAMGTRKSIAEAIVARGADYIPALKANQGNPHKEAVDQFHYASRHLDASEADSRSVSTRAAEGSKAAKSWPLPTWIGWTPASVLSGRICAAS